MIDHTNLETVYGTLAGSQVRRALAHEHFFVDFHGPRDPAYMDVDWASVTAACVRAAKRLRTQGIDVLIDWTAIGVGRSVSLLREISRRTQLHIVCATGIYSDLAPPALEKGSVAELAEHFHTELMAGIDGTSTRAGWIKVAVGVDGAAARRVKAIHRAAAQAARRAGAAIGIHCPDPELAVATLRTLEREGFDAGRFIWGHAQLADSAEHLALAKRGAFVQFDAIGTDHDPFFGGPTDDESMLDRVQSLVDVGFGDRVLISTDATVWANPSSRQYDRDASYLFRQFAPKLEQRIGVTAARSVLGRNVVRAFGRKGGSPSK